MTQSEEISPEVQQVLDRVEKLLRLAARNTNEAEAAPATSKAMELLAAYNLDMEAVEQNTGESGKRVDESLKGGHLEFQRDLWKAVAALNFCMYFSMIVPIRTRKWVPNKTGTGMVASYKEKNQRQHRIVGRLVNARSTRVMAEYLEQAIDRLLLKRTEENNEQFRSKWANSFREGAAQNITERLKSRRAEMLDEERRKARETAAAAEAAGHAANRAGVGTGREITLADMSKTEREANLDFLYGEGFCAREAKERAQAQQRRAKADADFAAYWAKWRENNPIEAALQDERARVRREEERKREERNAKRRESYWSRGGGSYREPKYKGDLSAFYAGYDEGAKISIDQQVNKGGKSAGALG